MLGPLQSALHPIVLASQSPPFNSSCFVPSRAACWSQEEGTTSVVKARVPGTRATFLALFRRFVTATAASHAPVKPTGFGVFARSVSRAHPWSRSGCSDQVSRAWQVLPNWCVLLCACEPAPPTLQDSAGRSVPLEEAAKRWAALPLSQRRVYEERARAEHVQAATELCRKVSLRAVAPRYSSLMCLRGPRVARPRSATPLASSGRTTPLSSLNPASRPRTTNTRRWMPRASLARLT